MGTEDFYNGFFFHVISRYDAIDNDPPPPPSFCRRARHRVHAVYRQSSIGKSVRSRIRATANNNYPGILSVGAERGSVRRREEGAAAINDDGAHETPAGGGVGGGRDRGKCAGGRGRGSCHHNRRRSTGTIHFYTRARLSIDPITPPPAVSVTKSIFSPRVCPARGCGQQQQQYPDAAVWSRGGGVGEGMVGTGRSTERTTVGPGTEIVRFSKIENNNGPSPSIRPHRGRRFGPIAPVSFAIFPTRTRRESPKRPLRTILRLPACAGTVTNVSPPQKTVTRGADNESTVYLAFTIT